MKAFISSHQLDQILYFVQKEYDSFAAQEVEGKTILAPFLKPDLTLPTTKTMIPFKKYLWPNGKKLEKSLTTKKIAFIGLTNCDAAAIEIFLLQFSKNSLLPTRDNILIMSSECEQDESCFCTSMGTAVTQFSDIHLQSEEKGYSIFGLTKLGNSILSKNGIRGGLKMPRLRKIVLENKEAFDKTLLTEAVEDRLKFQDFWQSVANNCFGCGACSAVCPLCFCVKQDFENKSDGTCNQCLDWDACFSKSFSEIQNHFDLRPTNINRIYNWYHHKLVRAVKEKTGYLCTGCGRCIKACPAHLNQHSIMNSLLRKEENE